MNIEDFNKKLESCEECLKGEIELGWGTSEKVMFIGQCPAASSGGRRGTSDFDKYLFSLIYPLTDKDFYFTNLVKVPVKNMQHLSLRTIDHYATHLLEEISIIKPKIIITLGSWSRSFCVANNIKHFHLIHPGAIFYGTITEDEWKKQLHAIIQGFRNAG